MMNTYVWSAKIISFFLYLTGSYVAAAFMETPPAGKNRGVIDGMPVWLDVPPLTPEQYIQQAERQKSGLLNDANNITADWRTELALVIISDEGKASLIRWMQYIKAIKAIDTSVAPAIEWPDKPE